MSFENRLKVLFEKKKEIQDMQTLRTELREQWQDMGSMVRSLGQEIGEKQQELLEAI